MNVLQTLETYILPNDFRNVPNTVSPEAISGHPDLEDYILKCVYVYVCIHKKSCFLHTSLVIIGVGYSSHICYLLFSWEHSVQVVHNWKVFYFSLGGISCPRFSILSSFPTCKSFGNFLLNSSSFGIGGRAWVAKSFSGAGNKCMEVWSLQSLLNFHPQLESFQREGIGLYVIFFSLSIFKHSRQALGNFSPSFKLSL